MHNDEYYRTILSILSDEQVVFSHDDVAKKLRYAVNGVTEEGERFVHWFEEQLDRDDSRLLRTRTIAKLPTDENSDENAINCLKFVWTALSERSWKW